MNENRKVYKLKGLESITKEIIKYESKSQIEKFYERYGYDWKEKYIKNEKTN